VYCLSFIFLCTSADLANKRVHLTSRDSRRTISPPMAAKLYAPTSSFFFQINVSKFIVEIKSARSMYEYK